MVQLLMEPILSRRETRQPTPVTAAGNKVLGAFVYIVISSDTADNFVNQCVFGLCEGRLERCLLLKLQLLLRHLPQGCQQRMTAMCHHVCTTLKGLPAHAGILSGCRVPVPQQSRQHTLMDRSCVRALSTCLGPQRVRAAQYSWLASYNGNRPQNMPGCQRLSGMLLLSLL